MIIVTDKMKKTMNDYPIEFIIEFGTVKNRIFLDGVYTDEKVSGKILSFTIIKSYDISEVIMLEILHIDIKNVVVGTEYYVDVTYFSDLAAGNGFQPVSGREFTLEIEFDILSKISDHALYFSQIYPYKLKKLELKYIISIFERQNTNY